MSGILTIDARKKAAEKQPVPGNHVPALDGVRGIAILMVLMLHFSYGTGLPPGTVLADRVFAAISRSGWVGVDLFFVLSGFLITGILCDSKSKPHYFRNFYARRVLRIFPVYYTSLLVFLVVLPIVLPHDASLRATSRDAMWYWTYLSNVLVAREGWSEHSVLGHFWSLAIEEQFYLVWPVIVLLLNRTGLVLVCLGSVVGSFAIRAGLVAAGYHPAAFVLTPARLDALAVGAMLALVARGRGGLTRIERRAWVAGTVLALILLAVCISRGGLDASEVVVSTVGHSILACFFGAVLVVAGTSPAHTLTGRIFSSALLRFFGRYSYGLYVFHLPLLFLVAGRIPLGWVPTVFGSLMLKQLVFMAVTTAMSVLIALASWHLYEKRFLALKRHFVLPAPRGDARTRSGGPVDVSPKWRTSELS